MTVKVITTPVACRKADYMAQHIVNELDGVGSVLDIGCGDGVVEKRLKEGVEYLGIDVGADNYPKTIAENIIYKDTPEEILIAMDRLDKSYDAVLLFDVLEHTHDFVGLFDKGCAKAGKHVVVSLPNEFNIFCWLRFLCGKGFEAQSIDLVGQPTGHRHLWVINPEAAKGVLSDHAARHGFELKDEYVWRLMPGNLFKRAIYSLLIKFSTHRAWSFHSVLVFAKSA